MPRIKHLDLKIDDHVRRLTSLQKVLLGQVSGNVNQKLNHVEVETRRDKVFEDITEDQINVILDIMTLILSESKSDEGMLQPYRKKSLRMLMQLSVTLLASNKNSECESWIKMHMADLISIRTDEGDSILHFALNIKQGDLSRRTILTLIIEQGKMDVNVANMKLQTPLHLFSESVYHRKHKQLKATEDTRKIAELIINNGAHMDVTDVDGLSASSGLTTVFPQWQFMNSINLKCLAARAILKHGVMYEQALPKPLVAFVKLHLVPELKTCNSIKENG